MAAITGDLFRDGFTAIDFRGWFGSELWDRLNSSVYHFQHSASFREQRDKFLAAEPSKGDKTFLIRLSPEKLSGENAWFELARHPVMVELAKRYFMGGQPLLTDCDLWHTEPMPRGRERSMSQNWHVDLEADRFARRIFKAFLYFNDIGPGNGPLELWKAGSSLEDNGPFQVCVPAGTMLLVDTGALVHRGGYCETGPRTVGLWHYTNGSPMTIPPMVGGRLYNHERNEMRATV